jgi:cobalt-zinc-cadmium efflux system membrane fusion protein
MFDSKRFGSKLSARVQALVVLLFFVVLSGVVLLISKSSGQGIQSTDLSSQARSEKGVFRPTQPQWASLVLKPVQPIAFRPLIVTEGKIAIDEDRSTPVFSPYTGRVVRMLAKPGDDVAAGQPLFVVEATDMVQSQNDLVTAVGALNKARSQWNLTQTNEKRQRDLYEGKAVPLKDWQQAQADFTAATSDMHSAESTIDAARNRLRILGRTDGDIAVIEEKHGISSDTQIPAPIAGTVLQRKIGPGQYVNNGSGDPAFVIGDLSTVWLVANVREADAAKVGLGQSIEVRTLAYPDRVFSGRVDYVAATVDSATRRILVRGTVSNPDNLLKPEMFATVSVTVGSEEASPALPREAIVYSDNGAHVWRAFGENALQLRAVKLGLTSGSMVQVVSGLNADDRVVVQGSLLIDRAAAGEGS